MNILIINLANLFVPNPAREHFLGVKEGFEINGVNVYSILPRFKNEKGNFDKNIEFIDLRLDYQKSFQRKLGLLIFLLFVLIKLRKILNGKKIDILYTRSTLLDVFYFSIAKKMKIKSISEMNSSLSIDRDILGKNKLMTYILEFFEKNSLKLANLITFPTEQLLEYYHKKYNLEKNKLIFIQNGISKKELEKSFNNLQLNNSSKKFRVGFAGIFSKWQGIKYIPQTIKILPKTIKENIEVILVGDGPERKNIEKLIEELELEEVFILKGLLNREEYLKEIDKFDIAIAPYIKEGSLITGISPMKVLSYLSQKKPVIVSDMPGVREIVLEANCGYLFEAENINELKECIEKAYKEEKLKEIGTNGFNYLKDKLTWDKQMKKIINFILKN